MNIRPTPFVLGESRKGRTIVLPEEARARHLQVIGAPGTGKSKALEYQIRQDILAGRGICVLDPHGYLYDDIVRWCARKRLAKRRRFVLIDPGSPAWAVGFNPLDFGQVGQAEIARAVDAVIAACARVWGDEDTTRTPLLRRCLRAIFHVLAEQRLTFLEAVPLMSAADPSGLRQYLTARTEHPLMRAQWSEFNSMKPREFQEAFASTNNRLVEFLHSPLIERIVGQRRAVLDFRRVMDEGVIVLVRLGGEAISPDSGRLLGALLINDLFLRALSRPAGSRPFRVYIDECHRFLGENVAAIVNEGRKFGLHLVLAHQNLGQLREAGEAVFRAVYGMTHTKIVFGGLDPEDADLMARSLFAGEFDYERPKRTFDKPTVVGYRRTRLESRSWGETYSDSEGETETASEGDTEGLSWDDGEFVDRYSASTRSQRSRGTSSTRSHAASESSGESEALEPILAERPTQAFSLDELRDEAAARLINLRDKTCIVKVGRTRSRLVRIPDIEPVRVRSCRIEEFTDQALQELQCAASVDAAAREIEDRRAELSAHAAALVSPSEPTRFRE